MSKVSHTFTDCRTEVGITVGLIDGVIAIARVLAARDLTSHDVQEALKDLRCDEDIAVVLGEKLAAASFKRLRADLRLAKKERREAESENHRLRADISLSRDRRIEAEGEIWRLTELLRASM